jgi:tRNA threonylcarbamoyladenosine biosynthesis protein TsaB
MNDLLPILSIETSSDVCSVALFFSANEYIELNYRQKHIHSQKLIDLIDIILKNGNSSIIDCKSIAVSMGPGSFTGLRIGLSAVKGLAFGANIPIIPVPTFDSLAFQISQLIPENSQFAIVIDASLDEFYFAEYKKNKNNFETLQSLHLIPKNEILTKVNSNVAFHSVIPKDIPNNAAINLSAYSVGRWAYLFGNHLLTFDYDYLEPNYFKKFIVKVK